MSAAESRHTSGGWGKSLSGRDARLHPVTVIIDVLFDSKLRLGLLRRNAATLGAQRERAAALQGELPLEFTRDLLRILATEREPHIRRGALILLEVAPVNLIPPAQLRSTYIGSVSAIDLDPDNTGNIGGLLRAGHMLAPHFEEFSTGEEIGDRRRAIARPWMDLAARSGDEDIWQTIAVGVFDIQQRMDTRELPEARQKTLERRRMILQHCGSNITQRQLDLLLVENGIVTRSGQLAEDLKHFAAVGIEVILAKDPKPPRRGRPPKTDTVQ